jgi:hypothetical protein
MKHLLTIHGLKSPPHPPNHPNHSLPIISRREVNNSICPAGWDRPEGRELLWGCVMMVIFPRGNGRSITVGKQQIHQVRRKRTSLGACNDGHLSRETAGPSMLVNGRSVRSVGRTSPVWNDGHIARETADPSGLEGREYLQYVMMVILTREMADPSGQECHKYKSSRKVLDSVLPSSKNF